MSHKPKNYNSVVNSRINKLESEQNRLRENIKKAQARIDEIQPELKAWKEVQRKLISVQEQVDHLEKQNQKAEAVNEDALDEEMNDE